MMKKLISVLLIVAVLALSLPIVSLAETGSCGDSCTYTLDSDGKLVITGSGKIKDHIFDNNGNIKSVEIGEGITEIGEWAFSNCSFAEVKLPASLEKVDKGAFYDAVMLKNIIFAENCQLKVIGDSAFSGISVVDLVIPASVQSIGDYGFSGLYYTKSITFLGCPTTISDNAFYDDEACVTIADGVNWTHGTKTFGGTLYWPEKTVEDGCQYCVFANGFVSITKKSGNTDSAVIKAQKFANNTKINTLFIGAGITGIGEKAFYNCTNLKTVTIEDNSKLVSIGNSAFAYTNIKEFVIPAGVKTLGAELFYGLSCKKITFLGCPTTIDKYAFASCGAPKAILADPEHWTHGFNKFGGNLDYYMPNGTSHYTGSVLSEGNIWIIVAVAVVAIGAVVAIIVVKKKKKPAEG